jgi:tyrosine-protein kinase Etk/Wzc
LALSLPSAKHHDTSEMIDFREIGLILRRRAGVIVACVVAATLIAILQVFFAVPQFTSQGTIYLGDAQGSGNGSGGDAENGSNFLNDYTNENDVETQIELITSQALIKNAILESGLNARIGANPPKFWYWKLFQGGQIASYQPTNASLEVINATQPGNYIVVIGPHQSFRLETPGGLFSARKVLVRGTLGVSASGSGMTVLVQPALQTAQGTPDLQDFSGRAGDVYRLSVASADALADRFLGGALTVNAGGSVTQPTKIAFLQVHWDNPYQAQRFLNQVMTDFITTQLGWKTQSASITEEFVSSQLNKVNASLAAADQSLAAYQSQTGLIDVTQSAQATLTQLDQYTAQRTALQVQIEALRALKRQLRYSAGPLDPYLVSQTNDTVLSGLTNNLADALLKLSQAKVQYTDQAQEVIIAAANVANLKSSIRAVIDNDLAGATQNVLSLDKVIDGIQAQVKTMPAEVLRVIALQRSSNVLGELYGVLMQKEQEAEISKAATIINTRIVTPAQVPLSVTSPRGAITIIFGIFAGLVLGVGLTFLQHALSGRYETGEQVRSHVPLPVIGEIPTISRNALVNGVLLSNGRQPFAEAFRLLRSRIYGQVQGGSPVIILITSAVEGDGKTTVALNLAKVLADDNKRTLFVNADCYEASLPAPVQSAPAVLTFDVDGLSNWPAETFKQLRLDVVDANGVPERSLEAVEKMFGYLRTHFDYIIVDCPPLPAISDAMILGPGATMILSVVRLTHTVRRALTLHNELLDSLGVPRAMVLNGVESLGDQRSSKYTRLPTGRIGTWLKRLYQQSFARELK